MVNEHSNIKILECNPNSHKCLICFSSNGITSNEKFEFENICASKRIKRFFGRIVFVRDPKKHFYIEGIDDKINGVDDLISILQEITANYLVYCIGYSSGGYMSILVSLYLNNVERVLNFGGVINVLDWHGANFNYNYSELDFVRNASKNQKKHFNLLPLLQKNKANIFSFYASKARSDQSIVESIMHTPKKTFFY